MPLTHSQSAVQLYLLELEGRSAGSLFSYSGGNPQAEVIAGNSGGGTTHKHLGNIRYQDMILECGAGMSKEFYDWISSITNGSSLRKSGAVTQLDHSFKQVSRMEFRHGLITSLTLPALDASNSDRASLTVKVRPEDTIYQGSSDSKTLSSRRTKLWAVKNFKLQIGGLESACRYVSRVNSLSWGQKIIEDQKYGLEPGKLELSDLVIQIAASHANPIYQWFDDFIRKGNSSSANEKNGSLDFLDASGGALFGLTLRGLGPFSMTGTPGNTPTPMTFSMYCNSMSFGANASAIG